MNRKNLKNKKIKYKKKNKGFYIIKKKHKSNKIILKQQAIKKHGKK